MAKSFKNSTPVDIKLRTSHTLDGDVDHYQLQTKGEVVFVNGHYYIHYSDSDEAGTTDTTVKLHKDGNLTIIRKAAAESRMTFDTDTRTRFNYQTPYGAMLLEIATHRLEIAYNTKPFSGEAGVSYDLYNGSRKLGDYTMNLTFKV